MKKNAPKPKMEVVEIAKNTYRLSDCGISNCYLLLGEEKALLIDCGIGLGDLKGSIEKLTSLPVTLVCTHGHVDHLGGQCLFPELYMHRLDCRKWYRVQSAFLTRSIFLAVNRNVFEKTDNPLFADALKAKLIRGKLPKRIEIEDGHIFELGGRTIKAVHCPGHSKGSIVLLDEENKLVFTGDNLNSSLLLLFPNSTSVEEWYESAKRIYALTEKYTQWWGHDPANIPREYTQKILRLGEEILTAYPKNKLFSTLKVYPKGEQFDMISFRTGNVRKRK